MGMSYYYKQYPFASKEYVRDANWWPPGDVWRSISEWCNMAYGPGHWEFMDRRFRFKNETDLTLFLLRWA